MYACLYAMIAGCCSRFRISASFSIASFSIVDRPIASDSLITTCWPEEERTRYALPKVPSPIISLVGRAAMPALACCGMCPFGRKCVGSAALRVTARSSSLSMSSGQTGQKEKLSRLNLAAMDEVAAGRGFCAG